MTTMNRIVLHHTGGGYTPSAEDLAAYHEVTDGDGKTHAGRHPILANAPGKSLIAGRYAAHVAGLNTGSIGLSMACMKGGVWSNPSECAFFPKPAQLRSFVRNAAEKCISFGIGVTRTTVLTHAEVQGTLGVKQKNKWDFDYDPFGIVDSRDPVVIGDILRDHINAEIENLGGRQSIRFPKQMPTIRRGSKGEAVAEMQRLLNQYGFELVVDGNFGPASDTAVRIFQKDSELFADGVVGKMTWAALQGD